MKTIRLHFFIIFVLWSISSYEQTNDELKILFIGNSYTYTNNLPQILVDLSESGGKKIIVDRNTIPGYTLEQHCTNSTSISKISEKKWDFIVLQEQSQIPVIEFHRYNSMYPAARSLDLLITEQHSNTVFFMTWGRKYKSQHFRNGYSSPEFRDFYHMQDSLHSAYTEIADELIYFRSFY
jgi:hypothetical protein